MPLSFDEDEDEDDAARALAPMAFDVAGVRARLSAVVARAQSSRALVRARAPSPIFTLERQTSEDASFGERNLSSPVHVTMRHVYNADLVALPPALEECAQAHAGHLKALASSGGGEPKPTTAFEDFALLAQALVMDAEDEEADDDDTAARDDDVNSALPAARYAARVFDLALVDSGRLAVDLGPHICDLLLKRLQQKALCSPALELVLKQRIALSSFKSARTGAIGGFQVPFDDVADSRLHYKNAAQRDLFTNREAVKDLFLNLRSRSVQLVQPRDAEFAKQAAAVMDKLDDGNLAWFAVFFIRHLLTDDSVPDKELQRLAQGNEDKMRKLDQRMSSLTPPRLASASAGGGFKPRADMRRANDEVYPVLSFCLQACWLTYAATTGRRCH